MEKIYWECKSCGWEGVSEKLPERCGRCNGKVTQKDLSVEQRYINFIEIHRVEDANIIDLKEYRFVTFSESRGYIFIKRRRKLED